jgi:hypothetical protein
MYIYNIGWKEKIINWESEQKSGRHRPKHSVQMMRKDPSNMEGSYH